MVVEALRIGAYSLPRQVIESNVIQMHLLDAIEKDLGRSMDALRKGTITTLVSTIKLKHRTDLQSTLLCNWEFVG